MVHDSSSSPEVRSRKRRTKDEEGSSRDSKRQKYKEGDPLLKVLVPEYAAGALLGKGGSLLSDTLEKHGGVVALSSKGDYYPTTNERIVMLSGKIEQIIKLNTCVMEKVQDPGYAIDNAARKNIVQIILTDESAGMLIGPKGKTIQEIQTASGARLAVGVQVKAPVPGERVLTISKSGPSGSFEQLLSAAKLVIQKVAIEPTNIANSSMRYPQTDNSLVPSSYNNMQLSRRSSFPSNGDLSRNRRPEDRLDSRYVERRSSYEYEVSSSRMSSSRRLEIRNYECSSSSRQDPGRGRARARGGYQLKMNVSITMDIPDELVGGVMGRGGSVIKDFVSRSGGARFKISEQVHKGEDRILTIRGDMEQCQTAAELIADRVEELTDPSVTLRPR